MRRNEYFLLNCRDLIGICNLIIIFWFCMFFFRDMRIIYIKKNVIKILRERLKVSFCVCCYYIIVFCFLKGYLYCYFVDLNYREISLIVF